MVDEIPADLLKCPELENIPLNILNKAYTSQTPCKEWLAQLIIPVHKKGSLSECNNYRGIALMSITAKLFNRLLLNRLKSIDPFLRKNQNGFRTNRSTTQQILAIRRLFETVKAYQDQRLLAVFIDFSKAFDSINWIVMGKILALYCIPHEIISLIMMMYRGSAAIVKTEDGQSTPIPLSVGVLQGDTLAPYLFIIMVDYVMRHSVDTQTDLFYQTVMGSKRASSRGPKDTFITDLDFADDIVLFPSTFPAAQLILNRFVETAAKVGLRLNIKKTEYMLIGDWKGISDSILVDGLPLKEVDDYKYLGAWVFSSQKDIKCRIAMAWKANLQLAKLWKSTLLSRDTKIRLFIATVQSILLYGAETWTITNTLERSLDGSYTRLLRFALNISWRDKMSNDNLYMSLPRVSQRIKKLRLQFAGHCFRDKTQIVKDLLFWKPKESMRAGQGRRLTYDKLLTKDTGRTSEELQKDMESREEWRKYINKISVNRNSNTA